MMFRKRTANLMLVILIGSTLLLASCQVTGNSSDAPPSLASIATPEPERPTTQSGAGARRLPHPSSHSLVS